MKRLLTGVAFSLLVAAAAFAHVAGYNSRLGGQEISRGMNDDINFVATSSGDLPGGCTVKIEHTGDQINGGQWELVVLAQKADGSNEERGTLKGTISSGALSFDNDGKVSSVSAQLVIASGTGSYAGISGGGTLGGWSAAQNSPQFSGTLSLNF